MRIEILSIGTELLLGHTVNTNAAWLSRELAKIGVDLFFHLTVGDNAERIRQALSLAYRRSDGMIVTGGLGPTEDDITTAAIAKFAGVSLTLRSSILKKIRERFARRKMSMPALNKRQAYLPDESVEIPNPVGTAPGWILETGLSPFFIIALPGVPGEMKPMFLESVRLFLKRRLQKPSVLVSRTLRTTGLPESAIAARIRKWLQLKPPVTVGIYAHLGEVDIRIMSKAGTKEEANRQIAAIEKALRPKMKEVLFGADEDSLESVVINRLIAKKKTVAVAESCTGGLLTHRLTNIPGSSNTLTRGLITYSNKSKTDLLGVPSRILKERGAVSPEAASLMAKGVRETAKTTFGIGISGIAGPGGGTKNKPVGLVYVALATAKKILCRKLLLKGNREEIKWQTSQSALNLLRLALFSPAHHPY